MSPLPFHLLAPRRAALYSRVRGWVWVLGVTALTVASRSHALASGASSASLPLFNEPLRDASPLEVTRQMNLTLQLNEAEFLLLLRLNRFRQERFEEIMQRTVNDPEERAAQLAELRAQYERAFKRAFGAAWLNQTSPPTLTVLTPSANR